MVVHAFPAAKLAALLIKQISKPIANAVKQGAKSSPVFRKYVCLPPAQLYNWCEMKSKMWLLHLGQPVNITVLNEAASIELGANLLGESVIFIIAAAILVLEYNRSSKKETAKEEARKNEVKELKDALRDLFIQTEEQGAHIRELTRKLGHLETQTSFQQQNVKTISPRNDPPPPPDQPVASSPTKNNTSRIREDLLQNINLSNNSFPTKGLLFKALNDVENNFFLQSDTTREPGILIVALNLLNKDVL